MITLKNYRNLGIGKFISHFYCGLTDNYTLKEESVFEIILEIKDSTTPVSRKYLHNHFTILHFLTRDEDSLTLLYSTLRPPL